MGQSATTLGKLSTAKQVVDHFNANLTGKLAVITGGNSGIGTETAKVLALAGCRVIISARCVAAGEAAINQMSATTEASGYPPGTVIPSGRISVRALDLESLVSVSAFADTLQSEQAIDFLVLNAGIMALPKLEYTAHGFERQIGTNHFGHFHLVSLLRPKLVAQAVPSRIVVLASAAHRYGGLDFADLHFRHGRIYSPWVAYGQSKTANILFAKELAAQLSSSNVTAVSVHPGVIATNLGRYMGLSSFTQFIFKTLIINKTIPQGAATTVYACLEPSLSEASARGAYLSDCAITSPSTAQALDEKGDARRALWEVTETQLREALSASGVTAA